MKKTMLFTAAMMLSSGLAFAGTQTDLTDQKCEKEGEDAYENRCEGNVGYYCRTAGYVTMLECAENETCTNNAGFISCVEDGVPTGACTAGTDKAGCSDSGNSGYYCYNDEWRTKSCSEGTTCSIREEQYVDCIDPSAPTGECDPATVKGQCSADGKTGYYCKTDGSGWNSKTCADADCVVNDSVNSVSCGSGETGECTSADSYCDETNKLLGHRCKDGAFTDWNCQEGQKCQEGYKADGTASPGWLLCVDDTGTDPVEPGECTARCSSDGAIAYNCANGTETPTVCQSGTSCKMNGTTAECAATIDNGGSNNDKDKDDDSGCSATGAGFLLGWMGLALLPGLRRRQR